MNTLLASLTLLMVAKTALAETYYVSPRGNDENPGSRAKPFRTIQNAADTAVAGDTCLIQSSTYREAIVLRESGLPGKPIRFVAEKDRTVLLDGTGSVVGTWPKHEGSIYKTRVDTPVEQLFVDRRMMVEARWLILNMAA